MSFDFPRTLVPCSLRSVCLPYAFCNTTLLERPLHRTPFLHGACNLMCSAGRQENSISACDPGTKEESVVAQEIFRPGDGPVHSVPRNGNALFAVLSGPFAAFLLVSAHLANGEKSKSLARFTKPQLPNSKLASRRSPPQCFAARRQFRVEPEIFSRISGHTRSWTARAAF